MIKRVIKGLINSNPIVSIAVGAAKELKETIVKNKASVDGGEGNYDYAELAGVVLGGVGIIYCIYLLSNGVISVDELIEMSKTLK